MALSVEIYGRDDCRFCAAAVAFCQKRSIPFVYHDMSADKSWFDHLVLRLNREPETVPQIFIAEHRIGGFDDLVRAYPVIQQIIGG